MQSSPSLAKGYGWEKLSALIEWRPKCVIRSRSSDGPSQPSSLASTWNGSAFRVCYEALLTPTCLVSFMHLACSPPAHKGSHTCDSIGPSEWVGADIPRVSSVNGLPVPQDGSSPPSQRGPRDTLNEGVGEFQASPELLPKRRAVAVSSLFARMRRRRRRRQRRMPSDRSGPTSYACHDSAMEQWTTHQGLSRSESLHLWNAECAPHLAAWVARPCRKARSDNREH